MIFFSEEGSAMDIDGNQTLTTPVSHQCVLSTLGAVCTEESIIHAVIPRLVEHVQFLCDGECLEKDISYVTLNKSDLEPLLWPYASISLKLQLPLPPRTSMHLKIGSFNFPPLSAKSAFKCAIQGPDLMVKCPFKRTNV